MRRFLLALGCVWGVAAFVYGGIGAFSERRDFWEALHEVGHTAPEEAEVIQSFAHSYYRGQLALAITGLILAVVSTSALRRRDHGEHVS